MFTLSLHQICKLSRLSCWVAFIQSALIGTVFQLAVCCVGIEAGAGVCHSPECAGNSDRAERFKLCQPGTHCLRTLTARIHSPGLSDVLFITNNTLLCGCPNRPRYGSMGQRVLPMCLSVHLSVHSSIPCRLLTWKWECIDKQKIAWMLPRVEVTSMPIVSLKGLVDGRIICWHSADFVLFITNVTHTSSQNIHCNDSLTWSVCLSFCLTAMQCVILFLIAIKD